MTTPAEELRAAVADVAEGTPYRVEPTERGFDLRVDLADSHWWGPLGAAGVRSLVVHHVVLDEARRRLSITDDHRDLRWDVGADGGEVPRLTASVRASRFVGRSTSVSFERTWALDETGEPRRVVDYTFRSSEGHGLIRAAARDLGWSEQRGTAERIALVAAAIGGGGAIITAAALITLALMGKF